METPSAVPSYGILMLACAKGEVRSGLDASCVECARNCWERRFGEGLSVSDTVA